ncbi:diguanylate cyclase [Deinococcus sp. YIM 77859]|uniref:GGDEF domain-containing protein n=1 Tax=Deinococcus sp. YIM 77859 TaxID=1540221 RepID=UPI001E415E91|nr:GGDEF domain-containing protein [Deinococcus sp. YIM 77859]
MRRGRLRRFYRGDPRGLLLLWTPLPGALAYGVALLTQPQLVSAVYLALVGTGLAVGLLALTGPTRVRTALHRAAPQVYALLLLGAWLAALYLLPDHPATPGVAGAVPLYLPLISAVLFAQVAPGTAVVWSGATLLLLGLTGLPVPLLVAHAALLVALWAWCHTRAQLARSEARTQALHDLAHQDPLTGLLNRRALERDLVRAAEGWGLAVIDVDGLKRVNDTLGHAAGDDLLRRVAYGLARVAPPGSRAYRLGGDEFALLLPPGTAEAAEQLVAEVMREVRTVYAQGGASVGTACWRAGEAPDAWFTRADQAMYRHKGRARG